MSQKIEAAVLPGGSFLLDDWLVEPSLNRLSKGDTTIQLELKVMDVLVCLAERAGEVVTRQEIVDRVWATEFISDNTLTHAITELRNALGDDARNSSFIETIHRRGYRRGCWIASSSGTEVRLWPMPDLSKPPLHTLPREELIAKLKTLTNLRVVRDEESATGWKLVVGPFPGWETVPTW